MHYTQAMQTPERFRELVRGAESAAARWLGEHSDVDRRLREAEDRFRALIERNADAIMVVDDAGVVRFANEMAERLFGKGRDVLVGSPFGFPLVAGETTELDLARADGARVVEMRVVESEWEGQPARLASLRDVTERRESERATLDLTREQGARAAAEEAAARFRFLAECSAALSSSLDYEATLASLPRLCVAGISDWAVLYVVREDGVVHRLEVAHRDMEKAGVVRALRELPWEPGPDHPVRQVIDRREPLLVQRIGAEGLRAFAVNEAHLGLMQQLGASSCMIVPMIARDRSVGAMALVASDPDRVFGEDDLALARDLALRAALALDNARLYREAQEANQAKTEFLAVISHDLRTPLSSIMGYADLLAMGVPDALPPSGLDQVGRIRTAANHLLYLIDELLAYARLDGGRESLHPRDFDARDVLREVGSVVEPLAAEHRLELRVVVPEQAVQCTTDPDKLRQALVNLAWNAVKFTEHGSVELELEAGADGERMQVHVRDTGVGIPPEHLDHIFQPFWQVRHTRRGPEDGTGLGLSVVQRLARMLGGAVSVQSEPGRGSTFTLDLPRVAAPAAGQGDVARARAASEREARPSTASPREGMTEPQPAAQAASQQQARAASGASRSQASVERLERGLTRIIEQNADGMMVIDQAGIVRFANAAAAELFDRPEHDLVGQPFGFPIVDADTTELDIVRRGDERVVELRVVDFDWEGSDARLVSMRDITSRRRAEEDARRIAVEQTRRMEAEERERRARFLADVSASLERSLGADLGLEPLAEVCCSSRFADWCAVDLIDGGAVVRRAASADDGGALLTSADDAQATSPRARRITGDLAERLAARTGGSWTSGSVLYVPLRLREEVIGALVLARRSGPFSGADLEVAGEVARRTAASIEHAYLLEKAQRAAAAKSDFLAIVSHELRTPLNAVIGYSDLLLLGIAEPLNAGQADLVKKVIASSTHLLGLVEEILTYTRMERGQEEVVLEPVALRTIVDETLEMIAPMARAQDLNLRVDIDDADTPLVTDRGKVSQILTNLLSNAVKYTERGSVELAATRENGIVRFRVQDTGMGMNRDQLAHIYEPFWQADPTHTRRHGGTGLGLTVALELTRLLRGRLDVASEPGQGTTFTLEVPDRAGA